MPTFGLDDTTVGLWRFDEPKATVPPSDSSSNVSPLLPIAAGQLPAVVTGALGRARRFQIAAYRGDELVPGALRLRRSMTLEGVLTFTSSGQAQTVACRGRQNGDAQQRRLWCVSLLQVGGQATLRFEWDRKSGVPAAPVDVSLASLPPGFFYLAVTREWRSPTSCTVSAYVNGVLKGSAASAEADIEDGEGGENTIGARWDESAPAYANFFAGDIDALRISNTARSAEEIAHTYRALFEYPRFAYETLRSLQPPGEAWSRSLDSRIQGFFQVAGMGLAVAWSKAAELLNDFLPDRAWSLLDRWEAITRLSPRPTDTIQSRRERVVAFLRKVQGYDLESIRGAVFELLGQSAGNVVINEGSNMRVDPFDAPLGFWSQEPNAGALEYSDGKVALTCPAGIDARWSSGVDKAVRLRTSVANDRELEVIARVTPALQGTGAACGLYVYNWVTGDAHLFGLMRGSAVNRLWHRKIEAGVVTETVSTFIAPAGQHVWLRYRLRSDGFVDLGCNFFGTGSFDGPWVTVFGAVPTIAAAKHWCGPFLIVDAAPTIGVNAANFFDFRIWTPFGRDVFEWFVYRDPSLPGAYDRAGAQLVIDKIKPGHTRGTVIESLQFIVGSSFSRVGNEPVGAA